MDVEEVLESGKEGGEVKRLFVSEGERMRGTGSRVSGAMDSWVKWEWDCRRNLLLLERWSDRGCVTCGNARSGSRTENVYNQASCLRGERERGEWMKLRTKTASRLGVAVEDRGWRAVKVKLVQYTDRKSMVDASEEKVGGKKEKS